MLVGFAVVCVMHGITPLSANLVLLHVCMCVRVRTASSEAETTQAYGKLGWVHIVRNDSTEAVFDRELVFLLSLT